MSLGLIFSLQLDKKSAVASTRALHSYEGRKQKTQRNYKKTFPPWRQHAVFHLERFKHLSFASFDIFYAHLLHFNVFNQTSVKMTINFFLQAGNSCSLFDFGETDLRQIKYRTVISMD